MVSETSNFRRDWVILLSLSIIKVCKNLWITWISHLICLRFSWESPSWFKGERGTSLSQSDWAVWQKENVGHQYKIYNNRAYKFETKYLRMDQVKFVERRPYNFKFFEGCIPQISLGLFLNILFQMIFSVRRRLT